MTFQCFVFNFLEALIGGAGINELFDSKFKANFDNSTIQVIRMFYARTHSKNHFSCYLLYT